MLNIRKACPEDAKQIIALLKIIGEETDNLTFGAEGVNMTEEKEAGYLAEIYESEKELYLVAEENGELLGTAVFSALTKPRLAHRGTFSLSLKKKAWGKGIGSKFMEEILCFARNIAKTDVIYLEVRSDNRRAIALYEKFGFEKTGVFKSYMRINGKDIDCDLMQLFL